MFKVNGMPLLANELSVIEELKHQLDINGLKRFHTIKRGPRDIQVSCPIHKDGQERKPSCGISTEDKGKTPAGTVNCFTCGYTANLQEMISHCFGHEDEGKFGIQWLGKNFMTVAVEHRTPLELNMDRHSSYKQENNFVTEKELDSYRFTHPYVYKRKLTDEIIEKFDIGFDSRTKCVTFPVWNIQGNCVFIARRSVVTKFFNYPDNVVKPVYGAHLITPKMGTVIICESIFNALTCWTYGHPAVALLGLGSPEQYDILRKMRVRKFILAMDPDEAGARATKNLRRELKAHKIITEYVIPQGSDINDLNLHQFNELAEIY